MTVKRHRVTGDYFELRPLPTTVGASLQFTLCEARARGLACIGTSCPHAHSNDELEEWTLAREAAAQGIVVAAAPPSAAVAAGTAVAPLLAVAAGEWTTCIYTSDLAAAAPQLMKRRAKHVYSFPTLCSGRCGGKQGRRERGQHAFLPVLQRLCPRKCGNRPRNGIEPPG